jgi:hypothetical protein
VKHDGDVGVAFEDLKKGQVAFAVRRLEDPVEIPDRLVIVQGQNQADTLGHGELPFLQAVGGEAIDAGPRRAAEMSNGSGLENDAKRKNCGDSVEMNRQREDHDLGVGRKQLG